MIDDLCFVKILPFVLFASFVVTIRLSHASSPDHRRIASNANCGPWKAARDKSTVHLDPQNGEYGRRNGHYEASDGHCDAQTAHCDP